jgi:hypothetical protein
VQAPISVRDGETAAGTRSSWDDVAQEPLELGRRAKPPGDDPSRPDPIRSAPFAEHSPFESPAIAWGDVLDAAEVREAAERRIPPTAPAGAAAPAPRMVRIAIDRIELVAPPQPPAPPRRAEPTITLDRYAERRR